MNVWLLSSAFIGSVLLSGCGGGSAHYSYAKSADCFRDIGKTRTVGAATAGQAVRISAGGGKTYDVLFLPSGSQAKNYAKRLDVKSGVLKTKGNAIVYGHQTGTGPAVEDQDVKEVEKCLA